MKCAAIALTLCLAACSTPASTVHLDEGKAVDVGWSTLNAAAQSADQLAISGQLHGAQAARVRDDLDRAKSIMVAADATYHAGSDPTSQLAGAAALTNEVLSIIATTKGK